MAQRTGAERFLASPAKSASARVLLALALAALLLGGCGGGSSDSESQGTASSAAAAEQEGGKASAPAVGSKDRSGSQGESKAPGAASGAPAGGEDSSGQGGQKQGPAIAAPKGPQEQAPSAAELANATVADMSLQSPAILSSGGEPGSLSPAYTCDGKDSWPALSWSGVPAGTAELALYVMNVQPVQGQLFVDWAVAGLDPGLTAIEEGKLPKGAVVGQNSFGEPGYSICPQGSGEIYMFAIYALPKRLGAPKGFDARELRRQILATSGNVGLLPALYAHS